MIYIVTPLFDRIFSPCFIVPYSTIEYSARSIPVKFLDNSINLAQVANEIVIRTAKLSQMPNLRCQ